MDAISLRGLTNRFGNLVAVDSVDLEIAKGELFGLLGPNGAGKTTIIKMLTTMLTPTGGKALVWGHDVVTKKDAVRSSVGVVFQDPSVDNMLTGRENLDFHGRMYGMSGPLRKERIKGFWSWWTLWTRRALNWKTIPEACRGGWR
jgi:ABC-2 type transport system ATP-binding protein